MAALGGPFATDVDYPADLKNAVEGYRAAWRVKIDEVNSCIAGNAEQEELVDQPEVDRKITRVSGPFTVEAVQPPEMSLGDTTVVDTAPGSFRLLFGCLPRPVSSVPPRPGETRPFYAGEHHGLAEDRFCRPDKFRMA